MYISDLEHVMKLLLTRYVLLAFMNAIGKYCYAWVILHNVGEVYIPDLERYNLSFYMRQN